MGTLHEVLGTGTGTNLVRFDILTLDLHHNWNTETPVTKTFETNGCPRKLLSVDSLSVRLRKSHLTVELFVCATLAASLLIGILFTNQHVKAIRCTEGG